MLSLGEGHAADGAIPRLFPDHARMHWAVPLELAFLARLCAVRQERPGKLVGDIQDELPVPDDEPHQDENQDEPQPQKEDLGEGPKTVGAFHDFSLKLEPMARSRSATADSYSASPR